MLTTDPRESTPPLPGGLRGDRAEHLANRYNSRAIHLLRRIRQADRELGVTPSRLSALSVLVFGGPRTLGALAGDEQVAAPTMSRIVAGLERAGLVRRERDPADARRVILHATEAGRRLMERGRALRIERLAAELRALPPADLDTLERAAEVLERLERPDAPERDRRRGR